jgi:xylosylprotein 4-beta-galactosyltransferase
MICPTHIFFYLILSFTTLNALETCSSIKYDANALFDYSQKTYKLAIIVPFRDRFEELMHFVPKISKYLDSKLVKFKIFIINQNDNLRFNRASLINVGFLTSMLEYDYIAMHDVDLIPINTQLDYLYPIKGPYHVSAPYLHPKYHYDNFIGGILLITNNHFLKVNGMSNKFWGWGREDDEFYMRLKEANLTINRPNRINSDTTNTFQHDHCPIKRKRDLFRYP